MPYYLIQVGYTPEAWAAMVKNPQNRIEAIRPAAAKVGGKIEAGYLCFGDYDLVTIGEFPDNASAAAFALAATAGGAVRSSKTTPLMTLDEGLTAMKKAGTTGYKPPSARAAAKRR